MRFNPSKHPWARGPNTSNIYSANGDRVAVVPPPLPPGARGRPSIDIIVEGEVNARLIEAAPELYEALEQALKAIADGDPASRAKVLRAGESLLRRVRGG